MGERERERLALIEGESGGGEQEGGGRGSPENWRRERKGKEKKSNRILIFNIIILA